VAAQHIVFCGRITLGERKALVQDFEARLRFRVAAGRVQRGEA
jgi:hypothetical protein